ncbi:MAG: hypothetical protein QXJ56_06475, partial [Ignisphaera sp.]
FRRYREASYKLFQDSRTSIPYSMIQYKTPLTLQLQLKPSNQEIAKVFISNSNLTLKGPVAQLG